VKSDPIAILEALYHLEGSEPEWVHRVLEAACPSLDHGMGVMGWTYSLVPSGQIVHTAVMAGAPRSEDLQSRLLEIVAKSYKDPAAQAWLGRRYARPVDTLGPFRPPFPAEVAKEFRSSLNASDVLRVSLTDPEGFGFALGALIPLDQKPNLESKPVLARVATHLRTAMRARMRTARTEAVLEADGRVAHCEEEASSRQTRTALREAARSIDRARGRLRSRDPEGAVALWRGLVDGTWTLVDQHESDGRRYIIARRNEPRSQAFLPGLSREETICLLYAAMGNSQKLIGYELGTSEPQVSRLLRGAMQKLGIASKSHLAGWFGSLLAASTSTTDTPNP
jgi:DNA-binding CsgD family transcriptional regulator